MKDDCQDVPSGCSVIEQSLCGSISAPVSRCHRCESALAAHFEIVNEGEVWAIDRSSVRVNRLLANSERLGARCIQHLVADSKELLLIHPEWKGYFHRILLDAPCSGLGTLSRHPDARWRMNLKNIEELVILQNQLLMSLIPLLKNGGRLVYSTCTIHPDENVHQIESFIKTYPEFTLTYEKQIWPGDSSSGDGFYVAVLDKVSI